MVEIVYDEIEKLSKVINKDEFIEIKASLKKEIEEKKLNNTYYFEKIINNLKNNTALISEKEVLQQIDAISEKEIKDIALKINQNYRAVEGILSPIITKKNSKE